MGLFGLTNPFDELIEKATSENSLGEDWAVILHVCDKINSTENGVRDSLKSIKTRLLSSNQRISNAAVVLLDAGVQNCGTEFRRHINEKDFTAILEKICETHGPVSEKLRINIAKWIEEYKTDMYQINAIYYQLQAKGIIFPNNVETEIKKAVQKAEQNNPDAVSNQQEEDDIAKAIAASLAAEQEQPQTNAAAASNDNTTKTHGTSQIAETNNLYNLDELSRGGDPVVQETVQKSVPVMRQAKALYDFEADEENEVTFKSGHMIILLDTSHDAWWRGRNTISGLEGLFPANFVEELASAPRPNSQNTNYRVNATGMNNDQDNDQNSNVSRDGVKLVVPLDLERVEQTLANLRVHDPALEEPDMLKFNEKMCEQMIPIITDKVHTLDEKFTEISGINDKFQNILASFGSFQQLPNMGGHYIGGQQIGGPQIGGQLMNRAPMGGASIGGHQMGVTSFGTTGLNAHNLGLVQNIGSQQNIGMNQQNHQNQIIRQQMGQQQNIQQNSTLQPQYNQGPPQIPTQQTAHQVPQQQIPQQNGFVNFQPPPQIYQYPPPTQ